MLSQVQRCPVVETEAASDLLQLLAQGRFSQGYGPNVCLIPSVVAWHGVTSLNWCGIGWTPGRDSRSWRLGGIGGCRVDWICTSSISMRSITPTSSRSVGISPAPQSRLRASPMTVEHALGVPFSFTDFQNAFECIRNHGTHSSCVMDVKRKVTDRLSQAHLPFQSSGICAIGSWTLGTRTQTQHRYRLGVFPVPHGSVDSKVFPSSDPLMLGALGHGKVALCQILCWFVFTWRKRETTLVLM